MIFSENAYSALLERIFTLTPSVQNAGFTGSAYKPGLDGMKRIDAALGHPWQGYRTIHVAGTNGKGSVASMLAGSLASTGARVGLYTSPHLSDFRERMKVITDDGWSMPSKEEVWKFFQEHDTSGLSFFEMTTALAFWWFRKREVHAAVVETGLGGRLDSTNIITPELSIITSIGLDHCALLGGTRAEIAAEKAGIFKPGVPALVASEDPETAPVFRSAASRAGCPLYFADSFPAFPDEAAILSRMDLRGPCQEQNLHTVLSALGLPDIPATAAAQNAFMEGGPGRDRLLEALENTAGRTGLRGRWERLSEKPEVICDIAHNPPALELNFARLRATGRPLTIVYGIMADKDLAGIAPLMPQARYILVAPDIPRAMPAAELYERLSALRPDLSLTAAPGVAAGISLALRDTPDSLVYIGGSTFVVTEALDYFNDSQP